MYIKSENDKNKSRVNLGLVTAYYPAARNTYEIHFTLPDSGYIAWYYDSEEDRDNELAEIDYRVAI